MTNERNEQESQQQEWYYILDVVKKKMDRGTE